MVKNGLFVLILYEPAGVPGIGWFPCFFESPVTPAILSRRGGVVLLLDAAEEVFCDEAGAESHAAGLFRARCPYHFPRSLLFPSEGDTMQPLFPPKDFEQKANEDNEDELLQFPSFPSFPSVPERQ